jgi:hypothetical protein
MSDIDDQDTPFTRVGPSGIAFEHLFSRFSYSTGDIELRKDRPYIVVSSTSYTADEDLQVLLDAAVLYDQDVCKHSLPRLVIIITGDTLLSFAITGLCELA